MVDEGRVIRLLRGISERTARLRAADVALGERLALAVGFRNVLVHQYAQVDDDIVRAAAHRLDEFERFVNQVSAWLADQPR